VSTCLVTGTTHGIGRVTALAIAREGFRVVMVCRDPLRGEQTRQALTAESGNENVHLITCDLASLDSVRACAAEFTERFDGLELLINNAGIMTTTHQLSPDGCELTFATNYLGPYLLTRLLLPTLIQGEGARIVNVASKVHFNGAIDLDALTSQPTGRFSGMQAYADSKLGNVMFTLSVADRLSADSGTFVTANCLHPGVVATNITAATNTFLRVGMKFAAPFMFDHERGARTSLHLALAPGLESVTGQYFDQNQHRTDPAPAARDKQARDALWRWSADFCGLENE